MNGDKLAQASFHCATPFSRLLTIVSCLIASPSMAEDVEQLIEMPMDQLVNVEFVSA